MQFDSPEAAFAAVADLLRREEWDRAAGQCDPDSLQAFAADVVGRLLPQSALGGGTGSHLTADRLRQALPHLSDADVDRMLASAREQADPVRRIASELPGVSGPEELARLTPGQVFARFLEGRWWRSELARMVAAGRIDDQTAAEIAARAPTPEWRLLGTVLEGRDLAHVLFRLRTHRGDPAAERVAECEPGTPEVASFRRQDGGTWRAVAGVPFLGTALGVPGLLFEAVGDSEPERPGS